MDTIITDQQARAIALACGAQRFERNGYEAKAMTQRNLSGRTHYADDDTLKFFSARINSARVEHSGLLLVITESTASGFIDPTRQHRFVAFDLFGTVVNDRDGQEFKRSEQADKAMREWLEGFDVLAHYKAAMVERAERLKREAKALTDAARKISTKRKKAAA